ncbi:MAG: hypothetical protein D6786_03960 [Gammaproteobacteria bacterium]|nr:MAG: hypothetical protein D6786_03960 [Gammaproteobacteria bacterium]
MRLMAERLPLLLRSHYQMLFWVPLLLALLGSGFMRLQVENRIDAWVDPSGPAYQRYQKMVQRFGEDRFLLIAFPTTGLTPEHLRGYLDLVAALRQEPAVHAVFDPVGTDLLAGVDPRRPGTEDPLRRGLRSPDGKTTGLLLLFHDGQVEAERRILDNLQEGCRNLGLECRFAGPVFLGNYLGEAIGRDLSRVVTALVLVSMLLMLLFLRSWQASVAVLAASGLGLWYTLIWAGLLGYSLNLPMLVVFPLLFCVAVTLAIHLFSGHGGRERELPEVLPRLLRPALIAMLTTLLGSLTLLLAPQRALYQAGAVLPVGIGVTFALVLLFMPAAYRLLRGGWTLPPLVARPPASGPLSRQLVGLGLLLATAASLFALPRLQTDPDALNFFPEDSPVTRGYDYIEHRLCGLFVIDAVITAREGRLTDPENGARIGRFLQRLARLPRLTTVLPGAGWRQLSDIVDGPGRQLRDAFLSDDGRSLRLTLHFREVGGDGYLAVERSVREAWQAGETGALELETSGLLPLILASQDRLLRTQGRAFPLVVLGMSLVLFLLVRTPGSLLLACAANLIPLALTAGAMALLRIPLNSINLFVAAIMLGVIVDDTVYLLWAGREQGSLDAALRRVGPALWMTSVTIAVAFTTLFLSDLTPVRQFGLLSVLAVASAWLCDVYLLPGFLHLLEVRHEPVA